MIPKKESLVYLAIFIAFQCLSLTDSQQTESDDSQASDFRVMDEIILELERNDPTSAFENIVVDENKNLAPVLGRFGPESNFSLARGSTTIQVVGTPGQILGQTTIPVIASQNILPQAQIAGGYVDPDGILVGIVNSQVTNNVSALQYLTAEEIEAIERGKRGALDLAQIIKCATGCDPLIFQGYGCFCGYLGSGEPVDGIDTCCKMHDWCYTTSNCMGLNYDLPYFVPFKWKCNGGAPYCIPGKSEKNGRNSCSHQLCECDREFSMCLKRYLPCPTAKATCKKNGKGGPQKQAYKASARYDDPRGGRPSINLQNLHFG